MIKGNSAQKETNQQSSQEEQVSKTEEIGIRRDVKAINTTIMLLSQKMGYLVRNEKVLSKNILILNEKIKKVEDKMSDLKSTGLGTGIAQEELDPIKAQIEELYTKIKGIKSEIDNLKFELDSLNNKFATKAEIRELKYLVDAINPLEFVTYKQLKELIKK